MTKYQPGYRDQILTFFRDVPFKDRIWDWQYEANPGATANGFAPIVKVDDQGVSGFNGVMPVSIKYEQKVLDGLWSCDFYVAARVRGQGLGKAIKRDLLRRAPVILSFGVSPQAAAVLEKMGWSPSPEVQSFKRIINPSSLKDRILKLLQCFTKLTIRVSPDSSCNLTWQSELPPAGEVDVLWRAAEPTYRKVVRRTYDYLDWRYQKHPLARYEFIVARSEQRELLGILVLRKHETVARVVDYIGCSGRAEMAKRMLQAAIERYSDARQWLATTSDSTLKRVFLSEGFFPGRSAPGLYVHAHPNLGGGTGSYPCEKGWFVMSGDSDGELLSAARDNWAKIEERQAGAKHD